MAPQAMLVSGGATTTGAGGGATGGATAGGSTGSERGRRSRNRWRSRSRWRYRGRRSRNRWRSRSRWRRSRRRGRWGHTGWRRRRNANVGDVDYLDRLAVQHAPSRDTGSHQAIREPLVGRRQRAADLVLQAAILPRRDLFEAVVFALHRWAVRVGRIGDPHPDLLALNRYAGLCLAGIPAALLFGQAVEPAVARSVGAVGGPIRVVGMRLAPCRLARHLLRALIGLHADPRRRPRVRPLLLPLRVRLVRTALLPIRTSVTSPLVVVPLLLLVVARQRVIAARLTRRGLGAGGRKGRGHRDSGGHRHQHDDHCQRKQQSQRSPRRCHGEILVRPAPG